MLRYFLLAMCAGLQVQVSAQGFNKRYDAWDRADFGWSVERLPDSSYIVITNSQFQDSLFYSSVLTGIHFNGEGVILDTTRLIYPLRATYAGWANASGPKSEGGIVVGGNTYQADETIQAALFTTDNDGQLDLLMEYGDPGEEWIGRQAKQTPDGGYVLAGETSTVGYVDAFILKTDSGGAVQWVETYGGPSVDVATSIDMDSSSGGYFMGGQWRGSNSNKQIWVQSLNDTGAVQWSKIWGSMYDEVQAHVTTLSDGDLLVASNWGTAVGNSAKYLAKLDRTDGSIVWSHTYGAPCEGCGFLVAQEVSPGGDLIAVGHTRVPGDSYYGSMLRTTNAGDSLWMRNYLYADDSVSHGQALFSDVQPTPDGGFIAVGVALSVAGVYGQDVWVIKTDSMGCIEPGCNLVTGMEAQITNMRDALRVYPNPVARGAALHVEIDLPEYFIVQGPLRLTVTDALGRLVLEEQIASGTRSANLPVTGALAVSGVYHLHLSDASRWISGATFVVE